MAEAAPDPTDRLWSAMRRLILLAVPQLRYLGIYEYVLLSGIAGPTLVARCTDPGLGMPDLPGVPMVPATDGSTATWSGAGTKFLVGFVNADPSRPVVMFGDPAQSPATVTIAGGSQTLALGPWAAALAGALLTFAGSAAAATTVPQVAAAASTLVTALGALPQNSTIKTRAA
jgi:hypothetical protein